jgi:hypothetical protein
MNSHNKHRRYFQIAGITVCVQSDLDFDKVVFKDELMRFAVEGPGEDNVTLRHCFGLPDLKRTDLGKELYRKVPWAISRKGDRWYYLGIKSEAREAELQWVAIFNADHTDAVIYSEKRLEDIVRISSRSWHSLSLLPTDQVWLAPLLADRNAVLLHSAGVILNGQGLLFIGHSEAGKSTTVTMLKDQAEILCDDRNVARHWSGGWRAHGTWSHGDVADVSAASAPLRAILFLKQDMLNEIVPLTDRKAVWKKMLATLVKSVVTAEWWHKEINILEQLIGDVPCYTMHFDKSGRIVPELEKLVSASRSGMD